MRYRIPASLLTAIFLLTIAGQVLSAGNGRRKALPVSRLYVDHICADPAIGPGIQVADTPAEAKQLWNRCRGRLVLGGRSHGERESPLDAVDLVKERLIYIHMGRRPTGGYHLDLAGQSVDVLGRTLVIPVDWREPSQDALVTQALTHPCLLLAVPRDAQGFDRIEVVDQEAEVRLSTTLGP